MTGLKQVLFQDLATIRDTRVLWPLALMVFVSGSISFVSLRALGLVVPACFLMALVILIVQTRQFPKPSVGTIVAWLVFVALVGFATTQSLNVDYASGRFFKLAGMSLVAVLFWALATRVKEVSALRSVMVISLAIGLIWGFIEGIGDGIIFDLTHDVPAGQAVYASNRPIVLLMLFVWPAALGLSQIVGQRAAWLAVLLVLACTLTTESQSAQLATLCAIVVFGLASQFPRVSLWMVGAGGVMTILGLPFALAYLNFSPSVGDYSLPLTVVARLDLWNFVAGKIMEKPLLGYGLEVGRFLVIEGMTHRYFGGPLMHHPHNAILQMWFGMGLLGASVAALGWAVLVRQIAGLVPRNRAYLLAALSCVFVVGTVSHGLWQTWWVSALVAVPFLFAITLADDTGGQR